MSFSFQERKKENEVVSNRLNRYSLRKGEGQAIVQISCLVAEWKEKVQEKSMSNLIITFLKTI